MGSWGALFKSYFIATRHIIIIIIIIIVTNIIIMIEWRASRREYWKSSLASAKVPGNVTPLLLIIVIIIIAIIAIINYTISTIAVVVLLISIIKNSSRLTPILTSFQVLLD